MVYLKRFDEPLPLNVNCFSKKIVQLRLSMVMFIKEDISDKDHRWNDWKRNVLELLLALINL